MNSFGWVIRQVFSDGAQYLHAVRIPDTGYTEFGFLNSPHNATILDTGLKDLVLAKLGERYPEAKYEAVELFCNIGTL